MTVESDQLKSNWEKLGTQIFDEAKDELNFNF